MTVAKKQKEKVDFEQVAGKATMRDWMSLAMKLDGTQEEILNDPIRSIVAVTWLHKKQAHGGANLDEILDMSQNEILDYLGVDESDESDDSKSDDE